MKAVHFGGGNIGRGFIGLLLYRAGYDVVFVDVNDELVALLNERGEYFVQLADETAETVTVSRVAAIHGNDRERVVQAVAEADLVTTAVGVNALKSIAENIASGIERRLSASGIQEPLHVIACENAIGGSTLLKKLALEFMPEEVREEAERRVAFPDAAVDRIVPLQRNDDPLKVVVEPYYEWVVDRSAMLPGYREIEGVHYADRLLPYIERKLFTVNTGHCAAAYHGYLNGCGTIREAMNDEAVLREVQGALEETGSALRLQYGFDAREHERYVLRILDRFRNPYLTDEVTRVGRSPMRKLSANERLVRPALLAHGHGLPTPYLARAAAAALLFDVDGDSEAAELQRSLRRQGAEATVRQATGLPEGHALLDDILEAYASMRGAD
ncbi:mannitol-1-phosphate 5-dehydrogenase [Paenibacillaceae bacterium WGS1546]|uniref:mannitol-1-phosphate 5-dehydrogenase n=1 Tax=Cohnella sp. WGS1546 TaxID=3366810 RepID=UPI00372D1BAE